MTLLRPKGTLIDISPPITSSLAVWPGDTPPSRQVLLNIELGDTITLSTLRTTVHLGAHADAPNHYDAGLPGIGERPLDPYIGPCQVLTATIERGCRIGLSDLIGKPASERVLLRTRSFADPERFNQDFAAIEPDLIESLADAGVRLIGIDTPSVDLFESKDLPAHRACLRRGLAILEGLVLTDAPDGLYELIALPLRLIGFDASPVRAVLRTIDP